MKIDLTKKNGRRLYAALFNLYLWLVRYFPERMHTHSVCDHLGPIDTLGHTSGRGALTSCYSDELRCRHSIHLIGISIHLWAE